MALPKLNLSLTRKQQEFIKSDADEVLYGGAAGGGKSYAQLIDAMLYGLKYKGSKQLILRRTFPELKRSLILTSYTLYPKELGSYNESNHRWRFANGSTIEFGYCDSDSDVSQYMSAEYDTIRFDELTTFTEYMYSYIISRLRGANKFPKQVKSSSNPGQVGHAWVKNRFINGHVAREKFIDEYGRSRVFIPATVRENTFLMESDPDYVKRLEQLPEKDRKALLDGNWDIFEGQYFDEFTKGIHVCDPFFIPSDWQRYVTMDYGLDMLAAYFVATDTHHNAYVYREVYQSGLIISEAAKAIQEAILPGESIRLYYAPPDLWNKRQDTGKSASDIFAENRIHLYKASNERVQGWLNVKEWLKPVQLINEQNGEQFWTSRLKFFPECRNLIRCLSEVQHDQKKPNDVATEPHELTHSCLTGDTVVNTVNGDVQIKDLVGKEGYVYCYDEETNQKAEGYFRDVRMTQEYAEVFEITLEDGRIIKATEDHKFLTQRGWVTVKNLTSDDEIQQISI